MAVEPAIVGECSTTITMGWSIELRVTPTEDEIGYDNGSQPTVSSRKMSILDQAKESAVRLLSRPWYKRPVLWNDHEWNLLERHSRAYDTQSLMISCGTVTMDRAAYADRQVLLIYNKNTRAWQLPKGRKNVHEDFAAAALRETEEETGIAVQPMFLRFGTRSTLPERTEEQTASELRQQLGATTSSGRPEDNGIINLLNKDIFCISQYPDPATGAMRHIYWYAAKPLRGITPDSSLLGQHDSLVMTAKWFPASEAVSRLKMSVERRAVALAVHYAEQMTEEEWEYSLQL